MSELIVGVDLGTMRHGVVCCYWEASGGCWKVGRSCVTHRFMELLTHLSDVVQHFHPQRLTLVVEVPQPYGVSPSSLFMTSANIGAFLVSVLYTFPSLDIQFVPMPRPYVKLMLLGTVKGKDKDIRDCLKRVWEGRYDKRYLKGDAWAALAVVEAYLRGGVPQYDLVAEWQRVFGEWRGQESQEGKTWTDDEKTLLAMLQEQGGESDAD